MHEEIASIHYFSIAILRHPWRRGYFGIDICSENGICSSRLVRTDPPYAMAGNSGVHVNESVRIRRIIREQIDLAAAKRGQECGSGGSAWKVVWPYGIADEKVVYK